MSSRAAYTPPSPANLTSRPPRRSGIVARGTTSLGPIPKPPRLPREARTDTRIHAKTGAKTGAKTVAPRKPALKLVATPARAANAVAADSERTIEMVAPEVRAGRAHARELARQKEQQKRKTPARKSPQRTRPPVPPKPRQTLASVAPPPPRRSLASFAPPPPRQSLASVAAVAPVAPSAGSEPATVLHIPSREPTRQFPLPTRSAKAGRKRRENTVPYAFGPPEVRRSREAHVTPLVHVAPDDIAIPLVSKEPTDQLLQSAPGPFIADDPNEDLLSPYRPSLFRSITQTVKNFFD